MHLQLAGISFKLLRARWFPDGRFLDDVCFVATVETHRPWNVRQPIIEARLIDNIVVVVPIPPERARQVERFSVVLDRCFEYQAEVT